MCQALGKIRSLHFPLMLTEILQRWLKLHTFVDKETEVQRVYMVLPRVTQFIAYYRIQASTLVHFGPCSTLIVSPKTSCPLRTLQWDLIQEQGFADVIVMQIEIQWPQNPMSISL